MDTFEVTIVGGGLAGLSLGVSLAAHGCRAAVIDLADPATVQSAAFDGRASAIAASSANMFRALGLWPDLADVAQPINDILVTDGRRRDRFRSGGAAPFYLHFDPAELKDTREAGEPVGHIVENRHIRQALFRRLCALGDNLALFAPDEVVDLQFGAHWVDTRLRSGVALKSKLCVAADGRSSPLRRRAGIKTVQWRYGQTGIVATVAHTLPHNGLAHEYFLPAGPFAMLPLTGNRSSLVWTEREAPARRLMALPDEELQAQLESRFGDHLGAVRLIGPKWSYPLSFVFAGSFIAPRLALVGDAAHGIHPIAGQGFNLGLKDVAALTEVVVEARRLGLDPGAGTVLERYQRWRRFDSAVLGLVTDGLTHLFANDIAPVRLARDAGLSLVNRLGPLRRTFMRHAAGYVGDLPKLLRGELV